MTKRLLLLVSLWVLPGCAANSLVDTTRSTQPPAESTTSIQDPATTTSSPPKGTTQPTSTTSTSLSPPELSLDTALSSPSAAWHSVLVESSTLVVSGAVAPGSAVTLEVSNADDEIVFESPATVDHDHFHGEVTLPEGKSTVVVVATGPGGTTDSTAVEARYEPEASIEFGFLTQVSATEIVADYAQWLTGEEANRAAFEDGAIGSVEEGVPNDYYIRNVNTRLRTLPLADDVVVWLATSLVGVSTIEVDLEEWLALFNDGVPWDYETDEVPAEQAPHFGYFGAGNVFAPYWLIILDGEVIAIEQQFIP